MPGVKGLEKVGADFIVIPCNTVHHFINEMQESVQIPILSIIEETKKEILAQDMSCVGVLASKTTVELKLYESILVDTISPDFDQQAIISGVIESVMGGKHTPLHTNQLKSIIDCYVDNGAEWVVLGCTELPLAIEQKHTKAKLFNTIEILAISALKEAYK